MTDMLERVTDAIILAATTQAERLAMTAPTTPERAVAEWRADDLRRLPPHVRQQAQELAKAAIEAMREPTDEMTWQGSKARAGTGSLSGAENTEATWRAMIDAALLSREGAAT